MNRLCVLYSLTFVTLLLPAGLQAATGCGVIKPDSTDAVAAAPEHHKVILENDAVRVLEARVPLHSRTHTPGRAYFSNRPRVSTSPGKP
jgi:hypothetical protein